MTRSDLDPKAGSSPVPGAFGQWQWQDAAHGELGVRRTRVLRTAVRAADKTRARAKSRPSGELVLIARVSRRYWCRREKKSRQTGPIAQMTSELLLSPAASRSQAQKMSVRPQAEMDSSCWDFFARTVEALAADWATL